jgi:hypothetical protein
MNEIFLKSYDQNLKNAQDLIKFIPDRQAVNLMHTDQFTENFKKMMGAGATPHELTKYYWSDQINTAEAWLMISIHRSAELLDAGSSLLLNNKILASSPIVRALLELTISNLVISGRAQFVIDGLFEEYKNTKSIAWSNSFEKDFIQAIWGTRIPGIYKEKSHLHQDIGIGKWVKEISKKYPEADSLQETYDILSDLCHPNAAGNRFFYTVNAQNNMSEVNRTYDPIWQNEAIIILKKTLSWSCVGIINYHTQMTMLINKMRRLLQENFLH